MPRAAVRRCLFSCMRLFCTQSVLLFRPWQVADYGRDLVQATSFPDFEHAVAAVMLLVDLLFLHLFLKQMSGPACQEDVRGHCGATTATAPIIHTFKPQIKGLQHPPPLRLSAEAQGQEVARALALKEGKQGRPVGAVIPAPTLLS